MRISPCLLAVLLLSLPLAGCGGSGGLDSGTAPGQTGTVRVRITDAPADPQYQHVYLVVREVAIHRAGTDTSSAGGWEVIKSDSTVAYDLLALQNGVFAELGVAPVPAGSYTQTRLKLSPGSTVVVGGMTHALEVPSGLQSGYKLVGGFDVPAGGYVDLLIDFDARKSITVTGNGRYLLKPTTRIAVSAEAGAITGSLDPDDVPTRVCAVLGPDSVQCVTTGAGGKFNLVALPPGSYTVAFDAPAGWRDTTIAAGVSAGAVTSLGSVALTPQ